MKCGLGACTRTYTKCTKEQTCTGIQTCIETNIHKDTDMPRDKTGTDICKYCKASGFRNRKHPSHFPKNHNHIHTRQVRAGEKENKSAGLEKSSLQNTAATVTDWPYPTPLLIPELCHTLGFKQRQPNDTHSKEGTCASLRGKSWQT